jgi:hypothetical protein
MSALNCFDCHELEQELKIARLMADTAYQRGREDAANAIVAQVDKWLDNGLYGTPAFRVVWLDYAKKLVVAARGDGEQ